MGMPGTLLFAGQAARRGAREPTHPVSPAKGERDALSWQFLCLVGDACHAAAGHNAHTLAWAKHFVSRLGDGNELAIL